VIDWELVLNLALAIAIGTTLNDLIYWWFSSGKV